MKYAILSDVHANLQALDAVLKDASRMGAETFISLGDTVGYGPQPAEALERTREVCAIALAGNHDDAVSGRTDADNFIDLAADAVQRHREALDAEALAWLKSLPYESEIEGAVCTHGDLVTPSKFYYVEDEADAAANFKSADFQLAFVGHTHRPALFVTGASGKAYKTEPQDFTLEADKRYIVNPGSVGYPRESNGVCLSSYVIYDSTQQTIEFRFLPFSVSSVLQRGVTPKGSAPKKRWILLAALGVLALAVLAVGAWFFAQADSVATQDDPRLVVTNRSLLLTTQITELRANLELKRRSCPVNLRLKFLNAQNHLLSENKFLVKSSQSRNLLKDNISIPDAARKVELTVLRLAPDDDVQVERFDPSIKAKPPR